MIVPSGERVRVVKSARAVRDPGALAAFVASRGFIDTARVLKIEGERSSVLVGELPIGLAAECGFAGSGAPNGERDADRRARVVVKVMAHDRPIKHFFQRVFGRTRHLRQWRGAELLMEHGFAAARPMVVFRAGGQRASTAAKSRVSLSPALSQGERESEVRRAGLVEVLVLEWLPGKTLLQHMADKDLSVKQEHALADAVGTYVGKAMSNLVALNDGKPSNIVIQWSNDAPSLTLIDTLDITICDFIEDVEPVERIADLVLEPIGVRVLPRRSILWRTLRTISEHYRPLGESIERGGFKQCGAKEWWRAIVARVEAHGDPTPRVDPLSISKQKRPR